jgi:dynein heavy chain
MNDKKFLQGLENCIRFGKWCLVENLGESLDAALEPVLLQQVFKQGGSDMIKLGDSTVPYSSDFKLYMTSSLPNPHYAPESQVKVSLLNFTITPKGLEDQLLGVFVVTELPEMEEKKNQLVVSNARNKKEHPLPPLQQQGQHPG